MPIMVSDKGGGNFTPAPVGQHAVVCCDVADLGLQQTNFGMKDQVRIYWMLAEKMEDGRPFLITRTYTASLNEKSNLRKDLEAWRNAPFKEEELGGFDLEKLIGVPALVQVAHRESKNGNIYANIQSIMLLPKNMKPPEIDPEYTRWQDREENQPEKTPQSADPGYQDEEEPPPPDDEGFIPPDDEIPF